MPNFVSPGVYVIEKDISDYPPTINSSVVGIVGFASRGPIAGKSQEKATLITSPRQLINEFGEPSEDLKGQALEGALEILEATNSMRFVRVADSNAIAASALANFGSCPTALVSGTASNPILMVGDVAQYGVVGMSAIGSADLATSDVKIIATVYDHTRTKVIDAKTYSIPRGTLSLSAVNGATTTLGLQKVFGGAMDSDRIGVFAATSSLDASTYIVGLAAGSGATTELSAGVKRDDGVYVGLPMLHSVGIIGEAVETTDPPGATASVTASGVSINVSSVGYLVKSLWPGAGYNAGTKSDGTTSGVSFEVKVNGGESTFDDINNLGTVAEEFKTTITSGLAYLETKIGMSYATKTSQYVTAYTTSGSNVAQVDVTPTAVTTFDKRLESFVGAGPFNGAQGGVTWNAYNLDISNALEVVFT